MSLEDAENGGALEAGDAVETVNPISGNWKERIWQVLGVAGYKNLMRRSFQSVILFEARRTIEDRMSSLRPHQRKSVLLHQAQTLLAKLDFLFPQQKTEVLWRTAVSQEPLNVDLAWKRQSLVVKELEKLSEQVRPFLIPGRTHQEACDKMMEKAYQSLQGNANKPVPEHWEHSHNHAILAFRIYYKGDKMDPSFPPPEPLLAGSVTAATMGGEDENNDGNGTSFIVKDTTTDPNIVDMANMIGDAAATSAFAAAGRVAVPVMPHTVGPRPPPTILDSREKRLKILNEVKLHLDLLQQFEGCISKKEIESRKRELFLSLPAPPPPMNENKGNLSSPATATQAATGTAAPAATTTTPASKRNKTNAV